MVELVYDTREFHGYLHNSVKKVNVMISEKVELKSKVKKSKIEMAEAEAKVGEY